MYPVVQLFTYDPQSL